ncbi:hypothetical protein C8J57DRAFT_1599750 [Mycena rebaudengoi]|nr:hypothetical protein C8J57DRAFT_1599750 [Mycena rebaudengoi]
MISFGILLTAMYLVGSSTSTTVHVNHGCISVQDTSVCEPGSVEISTGSAEIFARFDGENKNPDNVPGCKLEAAWPATYGDIYFGDDNCLYDSNNQVINGQCCNVGTGGTDEVTNPYSRRRLTRFIRDGNDA